MGYWVHARGLLVEWNLDRPMLGITALSVGSLMPRAALGIYSHGPLGLKAGGLSLIPTTHSGGRNRDHWRHDGSPGG